VAHREPLMRARRALLDAGNAEALVVDIERQVEAEVEETVRKALLPPGPIPQLLWAMCSPNPRRFKPANRFPRKK